MSQKNLNTRMISKHDTQAKWENVSDFIPYKGEIIVYDRDDNYSYERFKIGDGITAINDLSFATIQPDWSQNNENAADYVKNRTHYVEGVEEIVVLPETTITPDTDGQYNITEPLSSPMAAGVNYIVMYNGVAYERPAKEMTMEGVTMVYIGNSVSLPGGEDTGEPFIFAPVPTGVETNGAYATLLPLDGAESVTIEITTIIETIKTLDPKYLANDKDKHQYLTTDENGNAKWEQMLTWVETSVVEVLPETEFTFDESGESAIADPVAKHPADGNVCVVTFDGVEYETVATEFKEGGFTVIVLGNMSVVGGEDTGEPFAVMIPSKEASEILGGITVMVQAMHDGVSSATISIKENIKVYRKISSELLPTPNWEAQEGEEGYIENKTHWIEKDAVIIPPTVFSVDSAHIETPFSPLVEGEEYSVTFNETEYKCIAQRLTSNGLTALALGNLPKLMETGDSGEPFLFIEMPPALVADSGYGQISVFDDSITEFVFSIKASAIVHKLDSKYIHTPDWNAFKGENGYIANRTHYINLTDKEILAETTFTGLAEGLVPVGASLLEEIEVGMEYTVTWNGVDYVCVGKVSQNEFFEGFFDVILGNPGSFDAQNQTEEPFMFGVLSTGGSSMVQGAKFAISSYDGSTQATMKISLPAGAVHKIDPIYLPEFATEAYVDEKLASVTGSVSSVNGKTGEVILSASDVNALPSTTVIPSIEGLATETYVDEKVAGKVDKTITVNSKALSSNITLSASDVGALPDTTIIPSIEGLATETYVDEKVASLVESAPETLNTLNELAAALGDDPNFATTISTQIGNKVDKTTTVNGKALSSNITLAASDVGALPSSTVIPSIEGLATETYVDEKVAAKVDKTRTVNGKALSSDITLSASDIGAEVAGTAQAKIDTLHIKNGEGFSLRTRWSSENNDEYSIGHHAIALGESSKAIGNGSYAEGQGTVASGVYSHAEGSSTTASGWASHAEGYETTASGGYSHAEGYETIASGDYSHVQGKYNIENTSNKYAHIVGNGKSDTARSNAHTLDWNGNAWYQGNVYVGGTSQDDGAEMLATESYVDEKVASLVESAPDTLNTLNELAAALGDDPNFATTVSTQIGNKVDKTTTVNGKALSSNIILSASDVGALPSTTNIPSIEGLATEIYVNEKASTKVDKTTTINGKALSSNITLSANDVNAVPTTRTVNGKALSSNVTLSASDIGAISTATKIGLSGGVTGTTTTFGNSTNITIPVTDIKESYISWGGQNLLGKLSPFDDIVAGSITNCFAFLPLNGITAEYTRDGGTTWTSMSATSGLFLPALSSGRLSIAKPFTINDKIRVTIDNSICQQSSSLKKLLFDLYCIGVEAQVVVEHFYNNNLQSTRTFPLSGDWNSIAASYTFYPAYKLRFTFEIINVSEHNNPGFSVEKIVGIGETIWGSNMAKTGELYTYDGNQNAIFPAQVSATQFTENGKSLASKYVAQTRTINGKALTSNITLSANDIGALPSTTVIPSIEGLATETYVNEKVAAPRDYIALTDQVTGKIYRLTMENGSLITTLVEGGE